MKPKKILIFGSCVSRDPFENLISKKIRFEIVDYFARSSFASLSSPPVYGYDFQKISSPFQRKMVLRDFDKSFLNVDFKKASHIIIDFIDDRFQLLKFNKNFYCTNSEEFRKSEIDFIYSKIEPFSDEFYDCWEAGWRKAVTTFKKFNSLHAVVINKVFLAYFDDMGVEFKQVQYINKLNGWLSRVYERVAEDLTHGQFLDYGSTPFVAKHDHRWGRSPFHFIQDVELKFISNILVDNN